jgi:hypothetical protein
VRQHLGGEAPVVVVGALVADDLVGERLGLVVLFVVVGAMRWDALPSGSSRVAFGYSGGLSSLFLLRWASAVPLAITPASRRIRASWRMRLAWLVAMCMVMTS